jgi:molybdenum cofactor cytidylyltransferase
VHEVAIGERHIGCKKLANEYPNDVHRHEAGHDRYTTDLDTPDDYARLLQRFRASEERPGRTDSQVVTRTSIKQG